MGEWLWSLKPRTAVEIFHVTLISLVKVMSREVDLSCAPLEKGFEMIDVGSYELLKK